MDELDGEVNSHGSARVLGPVVDNTVYNFELTVIAANVPICHDRPLFDMAKDFIFALGDDVSRRSHINVSTGTQENGLYSK